MSEQVTIPNIDIAEISLINTATDIFFRVYPRDKNEPFIFNQIIIDEDMFAESVSGTLLFNDPAYLIDQLNFTSFDKLQLQFKKIAGDDTGYEKTITFRITEIVSNANMISKTVLGPAGAAIPIAVKFASDEILYKNFDSSIDAPFIGKISTGSKGDNFSAASEKTETPYVDLGVAGKQLPGFVEYIFNTFGKPSDPKEKRKKLVSDETYNGVFIKTNPSYYPWNKIGAQSKISQLMNYVCEYACYQKNENAVNYFFWEDLDQFNFRCVESLLDDASKSKPPVYTPTLNEQDLDTIMSLTTVTETPVATLISNGAFSGEYVRIKPNWQNPYRNIIDTADAMEKYQVVYDYYADKNTFKKITPYPPIDQNKSIDMSLAYGPNRISDNNYGYFQNAYSQKQNPWWNYWDSQYKGYDGKGGDNSDSDRIEDVYWQSQFDFCELPVTPLKIIFENIKWPLNDARASYANLKRNKVKWQFYKNTILGERPIPTSFYAILTGASKIYSNGPGGIWSYSFREIELFPNSRVNWLHANSAVPVSFDSDFNGNQHPFKVLAAPWGIQGTAYNVNELLNGTLPSSSEVQGSQADGQTALLSPGISAKIKKNANGAIADDSAYPKNFRMMAVGRFNVRSRKNDDTSSTTSVYVGRIVKIDVLDAVMLDTMFKELNPCGFLLPEEKSRDSKVFLFDVENSNDGIC